MAELLMLLWKAVSVQLTMGEPEKQVNQQGTQLCSGLPATHKSKAAGFNYAASFQPEECVK